MGFRSIIVAILFIGAPALAGGISDRQSMVIEDREITFTTDWFKRMKRTMAFPDACDEYMIKMIMRNTLLYHFNTKNDFIQRFADEYEGKFGTRSAAMEAALRMFHSPKIGPAEAAVQLTIEAAPIRNVAVAEGCSVADLATIKALPPAPDFQFNASRYYRKIGSTQAYRTEWKGHESRSSLGVAGAR